VEHLRTTHFAQLLAAAAMIALVLTAKPYNPGKALTELQQILQLKARWQSDWVRETALSSSPLTVEPRSVQMAKGQIASGTMLPFSRLLYVSVPAMGETTGNANYIKVSLDGTWTLDPVYQAHNEFSDQFPGSTLQGMKSWWERLANTRPAAVVQRLLRECLVFDYSHDDPDMISCSILSSKGNVITDSHFPIMKGIIATPYLQGIPRGGTGNQYDDGHYGYWFTGRTDNYLVRIYASYSVVRIDQAFVAAALGVNAGRFETTFADLAKASEGLEAVPLEKLETRLSDELAKGADTLEAFGLKIPAELLSNWGTLLLICGQLYLIVYLRQLSGRLKDDDEGWNVPWIALEDSWLGQSMYAASLAATPLAVEMLRWHAWHPSAGSRPNWLGGTVFVALMVLSVMLAISCWHYRPLKKEQIDTPEAQKADSAAS
jgi:hypothetical protein